MAGIRFYLFLLVFVLFSSLYGQEYGRLRGFVSDSSNGESLPYSNVYIEELGTGGSANERGLYYVNQIPSGHNYSVTFSYVGYLPKTIDVFISPDKITELNIQLSPIGVELQAIEKIGKRIIEKNETDVGLTRLSLKNIESLPKGVETDLLRSLKYIPGVQATSDVTAKYFVRGGNTDQNLVVLNGVTIYNPYHALGMFSVIDPDMINNVEFYKGGFPAEYHGRVSSVLNVITKDGNKNRFSAATSWSLLSGKMFLEGPIPNGSFFITARKSYSKSILEKMLSYDDLPVEFHDLSYSLTYSNPDVLKNSTFKFFGFFSEDRIQYKDPTNPDYYWRNNLFGIQWMQVYEIPLFSVVDVSMSSFYGEKSPNLSSSKYLANHLTDFNISMNFNYIFESKDELKFGVTLKKIDTRLTQTAEDDKSYDIKNLSGKLSFFAKYKFMRYENFGLDIGSRFNLTGLIADGSMSFEPRAAATYRIFDNVALKAAWGLYLQELIAVSDENEIINLFEPWVTVPDYLKPLSAIHYIGGITINAAKSLDFTIEGYYKILHNLPILNSGKTYSWQPDFLAGKGESYGYEFSAKYSYYPLTLNIGYSLSWAYKSLGDYRYYPKYDTRHILNTNLELLIGAGWTAGVNWSYSSGLPFTEIYGFYDKPYFTNLFGQFYDNVYFSPYTMLAQKNLGRLADYHRLDFILSKQFKIYFFDLDLDLSLLNVYNRKNIFYYERDTGKRVNMLPFFPSITVKLKY